ncbi:ABC transporter permease [Streptomyces hainanensis]|uniref:ABC transporter permease n=1 Tax=Streptomyces hainanensis TaxID=402648 RepID=A0A4R4TBG7_9ACTN|nr:ABC transporter permease [Streptomyces hainanensis]TDC74570.1 ABC transporter permease [Streptomyces hainanensis]
MTSRTTSRLTGRLTGRPTGTGLGAAARGVFLTLTAGFVLLPLAVVVLSSFSADEVADGGWPNGWSLRWFREALEYEPFRVGLAYSLQVAALATAISLAVGAAAAYAIARYRFPGAALLRAVFVMPLSLPRVVTGFCLFVLYASLFPTAYGTVGGIAFAHCLLLLPFVVSVLGAALAGLDPALEEAARDLGASPPRAFLRITLPQIRPALIAAAVFAFITSFDEVDTSVFLMPADQTTLPVAVFLRLEQQQDPTVTAMSSLLIAGSLLLAAAAALAARGVGAALVAREAGTGEPGEPKETRGERTA